MQLDISRISLTIYDFSSKDGSYKITLPSYSFLSKTSGAIYAGVPTVDFGCECSTDDCRSKTVMITQTILLYIGENLNFKEFQTSMRKVYTFEYPKSQIFKRGAGLPSNNVFSNFKSRWHICYIKKYE